MASVALSLLDELYLSLDSEQEPWGVHFEVGITGLLQPERLIDAIRVAASRHPIARAKLARARRSDLVQRWEIADELDPVPLAIAACGDAAALALARERLFASSPSLHDGPPFTVLLARTAGGDSLMLNLHHGAGDGMSAARLMLSILRAYAGADDPVPALNPLAVRDVRALAGAATPRDRLLRRRALRSDTEARMAGPTTRVARDGGDGRPGYGFELAALSAEETAAVLAQRMPGTTVNDVLLAAMAIAVRRWNDGHARDTGQVALTMPVNLRPAAWRTEMVANFAAYATVSLGRDACDLRDAVALTGERTRRIKDERLAGTVVDMLAGPSMLTVGARRALPKLIKLTGDVVVDTATVSNLGRVGAVPALGHGAESVDAVWFSPPGRMPLGATIGVATLHDRLHLTLRYRHPQFGRAAAQAFMGLYRDVLLT